MDGGRLGVTGRTRRLGVVGTMVWDTIHQRDPATPVVEEWGGIAYALAAFDATLGDDWSIAPLVKVGRDLAVSANAFLQTLRHPTRGTRFIEVPEPNNRVTLRYTTEERRCERLAGGVPPWTWDELGPLVADCDALYVNFISGMELSLETARHLRRGFPGPIYADLHSLFLGLEPDGTRPPRALPDAPAWFACFDYVQLNEIEMQLLGPDPLAVAATALAGGCTALCVTLGARGVVYFEADAAGARTIRTRRVTVDAAERAPVVGGDPTGCGDVLGATAIARLVAGAPLEEALRAGARLAARNVAYRGASGLRDFLLGHLASA